jgi:hypothetical protein
VHLAQVVAMAVLARADVVLTVHREGSPCALAAAAVPARRAAAAQRAHPGHHEQRRGVDPGHGALHEAERVDQAQPQRPEGVPAAAGTVDAVVQRSGRLAREPLDHELRRAAQLGGQLLGEQPEATGVLVGIAHLQQDLGGLAPRQP